MIEGAPPLEAQQPHTDHSGDVPAEHGHKRSCGEASNMPTTNQDKTTQHGEPRTKPHVTLLLMLRMLQKTSCERRHETTRHAAADAANAAKADAANAAKDELQKTTRNHTSRCC